MAKPIPICPRCGLPATRTQSPTIGIKNRCVPCGLWSRGSKPLRDEAGHWAFAQLLSARRDAHLHFDPLWKEGYIDKETACVLLAQELGIERNDCRIHLMSAEVARCVPRAVKAIRSSLDLVMRDHDLNRSWQLWE